MTIPRLDQTTAITNQGAYLKHFGWNPEFDRQCERTVPIADPEAMPVSLYHQDQIFEELPTIIIYVSDNPQTVRHICEARTSNSIDRITCLAGDDKAFLPISIAAEPPATTTDQPSTLSKEIEQSKSIAAELYEIRRIAGASWEQIGRLIGVQRRTIHHWTSGKRIARKNQERVGKLLATLRYIDRGNVEENRSLLHGQSMYGVTLFELLCSEQFAQVREIAGEGRGRPSRSWQKIDTEKAAAYAPETLDSMIERATASNDRVEDNAASPVQSKTKPRRLKFRRRKGMRTTR